MSLINQMLKDLERRDKVSANPKMTLSGLISTEADSEENMRKKIRYVCILMATVVFIFLGVHKFGAKHLLAKDHFITHPESQITTSPEKDLLFQVTPETTATLTGISLETEQNVTELRFFLNHDTSYHVATNADESQLILTLNRTTLIADMPPVDYLKSAIQGMEMTSDKNGNLKMTFSLRRGAEISFLDMVAGDKSPELRMKLSYSPSNQNQAEKSEERNSKGDTANFSVKKTDEYNAKLQYENAMNDIGTGQIDSAILMLSDLVDTYPNYVTARVSLVDVLLQQGSKVKARKILEAGLALKPYYPPFIEMKARIFVTEGKTLQALSLLERAPPAIQSYPDYFAFLAALYRERGQTARALSLYEKLIQLNPSNSIFWAGYGITLESSGRSVDAKNSYLRAAQIGGLTLPLQSYVSSRIDVLSSREG